jgi:hypothetical protein
MDEHPEGERKGEVFAEALASMAPLVSLDNT